MCGWYGGRCRVNRWDVLYGKQVVTSQAFSFHLGNKNIERDLVLH